MHRFRYSHTITRRHWIMFSKSRPELFFKNVVRLESTFTQAYQPSEPNITATSLSIRQAAL
jgi:hypothetical protein